MGKIRKNIINIFKSIDFKIEITTNLTKVNFLDATFDLERNTYRPYKKPNDNLIYTFFFYKQSIFDPRPENCLSFSKKSPQKIV